ncbi:MAG: CpsD/CapB family tyrosine-protein kinase, partial [Candidatus Entotheonellia bacterium]
SLKSVDEVERVLGVPVFGTIPDFQPVVGPDTTADVDPRLVVLCEPKSSAAEGYRTLRTNIQFAEPDKRIKTLVVTSPLASEGKTVSAANIAVVMSQLGQRTLLVDADQRRPTIHQLFHVPQEPGLSDVLIGAVSWREAVKATPVGDLFVLSCGRMPPNPAELLGSARMSQLLEEWGQEYDRILLDCPPMLAVTDPAMLASKCDKTLLVIRANQTPKEAAQRALGMLGTVHAAVMGIILNGIRVELGYGYRYGYSYYYYHRHYHRYYSEEPRPRRRRFLRRWFARLQRSRGR